MSLILQHFEDVENFQRRPGKAQHASIDRNDDRVGRWRWQFHNHFRRQRLASLIHIRVHHRSGYTLALPSRRQFVAALDFLCQSGWQALWVFAVLIWRRVASDISMNDFALLGRENDFHLHDWLWRPVTRFHDYR